MKPARVAIDEAGLSAEQLRQQPRTQLGRIEPVELNAILARNYPPDTDAIIGGGIAPRQTLIVVGAPPKRGKSLLVKQQVIARTLGWPWLGFPTTSGPTLIIQAEIPERELQARLKVMLRGVAAPIPTGLVHFVTHRGLRLDRPDGLRVCRTLIETLTPDLIVLDPLARFMSGDENSTRDMGRVVATLDELIQAYGVAIILVHHTAKPSRDDPRDGGLRLRGSSALFGAADSILMLDRSGEGFRLAFELRHGKEPDPMLLRRTEHLWLEPAGAPAELLEVAAIVATLPLRYGQLIDAIQADLDVKERTAQSLLARAKKAGVLALEGGLYRSVNHRKDEVAAHGTASYRNDGAAVVVSGDE